MKTKVYIETSVVSYLTSAPSRDLVVAAHQQVTRDWWGRREQFDLFISEAVLEEAAAGDPEAAAKRTAALEGITVLRSDSVADALAHQLVAAGALPHSAAMDAVHVATAAINNLQILLTWNCAHLANPATRAKIDQVCRRAGRSVPIVCTPLELGGS